MARMAIDVYPTRPARFGYGWLIASGLLIAVYLITYLFIPDRFSTFAGTYAVAPLLWFLLLGVVIFLSRRARSDRAYIQSVILVGLVLGVFQIACLIIAGMIAGFGQSPYSHSVKDIFLNLLVWVPPLIALEFTRSYLLKPFSRRHTALMLALTTLLFAFIMVPLSRYSTLDEYERFLPFAGGTGLPLLAENMLAGVLVLLGGPWAAIAYRGALEAYEWFSPILPDLAWIVTAFVGTLAPVAGYLALQSLYGREFDAQAAKPKA